MNVLAGLINEANVGHTQLVETSSYPRVLTVSPLQHKVCLIFQELAPYAKETVETTT